jgi:hypothetical protein
MWGTIFFFRGDITSLFVQILSVAFVKQIIAIVNLFMCLQSFCCLVLNKNFRAVVVLVLVEMSCDKNDM